MQTTSLTLLEAVQGNPHSPEWGRFTRLYRPLLETWARRNGFQPTDAEDLAQEILLKLLAALPDYRREEGRSFRSWLFRLATNAGHDFRRRVATRAMPAGDGLSGVQQADSFADLEDGEYVRELTRRAVEAVRGGFGEQTMAAFTGTKIDGRPAAEVAAALGMTPNAVYMAVNRVMTRLRHELDGLLD